MAATAVSDIGGMGHAGPRTFTAVADPTAQNDAPNHHKVGDVILNTVTDSLFVCADATANAAVWHNTNTQQFTIPWAASSGATVPGFVVSRACTVIGIIANVEVSGTGGAATGTVKKAPSGTAIGSGTALHAGTINLAGTAATNQSLTLAAAGALSLNAGDRISLTTTGTLTSALGSVTILTQPK